MRTYIKKLLLEYSSGKKYDSLYDVSSDYGYDQWKKDIFRNYYGDAFTHFVEQFNTDVYNDLSEEEQEQFDEMGKEELSQSEIFNEFLLNEYERIIDNMYEVEEVDDNHIRIYRAIGVDKKWIKNLYKMNRRQHLGVYWSSHESGADEYYGGMKRDFHIIVVGIVPKEGVDWLESYKRNLDPSLGQIEHEILLFKNVPIHIEDILIRGDNQSIKRYIPENIWTQILNNTYLA